MLNTTKVLIQNLEHASSSNITENTAQASIDTEARIDTVDGKYISNPFIDLQISELPGTKVNSVLNTVPCSHSQTAYKIPMTLHIFSSIIIQK